MSFSYIPAGTPFLDELAKGLLARTQHDPLALTRYTIFLPYRRACKSLQEALFRHSHGSTIFLPKFQTLGDDEMDEEDLGQEHLDRPKILSSFRQWALLTRLVHHYAQHSSLTMHDQQPMLSVSAGLAKHLMALCDQMAIEEIAWDLLDTLVPDHLASHWQMTLDFLSIVRYHWPEVLAQESATDRYTAHRLLVDQRLTAWKDNPPCDPIIAAGSLGTMPVTARLLEAIAQLPQGEVIFPDIPLPGPEQQACARSASSHPYEAGYRILDRLGLIGQDIPLWSGLKEIFPSARTQLFKAAYKMAPMALPLDQALEGLHYYECASIQEEVEVTALIVRDHLERGEGDIAVVTPDRNLATRLQEHLKVWSIEVDNSQGLLLSHLPTAVFFKHLNAVAFQSFNAVTLLALLKHPFALLDEDAFSIRAYVRQFERHVLRGYKGSWTLEGLKQAIPKDNHQLGAWFEKIVSILQPWMKLAGQTLSLKDLLSCHRETAEAFASPKVLEEGIKGRAFFDFYQQLYETADTYPPLSTLDYAYLLDMLMGGQTVHLPYQGVRRVKILGHIETRLHQARVMILSGLNEGTWPPSPPVDPWLSQPMREAMGLPALDRRTGLSAHDFGQAFACPKVFITRARRVEGAPTKPAPWLVRLETYLQSQGKTLPHQDYYRSLATTLRTANKRKNTPVPLPMPPVAVRPREFWVSDIEVWRKSPYAFYAKRLLKLVPLDPLHNPIEAAHRGTLFHKIVELFYKDYPQGSSPQALDHLMAIADRVLEEELHDPTLKLFWKQRFYSIARWLVQHEQNRQTPYPIKARYPEIKGAYSFERAHGTYTLRAKADRIDHDSLGNLHIIDYKTGMPPSKREVEEGFSPQLILEALIAQKGTFGADLQGTVATLSYWWLKGGRRGGEEKPLNLEQDIPLLAAEEGLHALIDYFADPTVPYHPQPFPHRRLRYQDYDHLIRSDAWGQEEESEG